MIIIDKTHPVPKSELFSVVRAEPVDKLRLRIYFSNGRKRTVDFAPFLLHYPNLHPSFKKYQNPERFKKFKIVSGNLNWNNYEMIFPLEELYEGKIRL